MSAPVINDPRRKGIAVILTTLSMFVIVPMVGLGIDVSTLYIVRAKLFEAADAAALAGARALSQGPDSNTQKSNAQTVATRYFNANFPSGFWGATNITLATPTVDSRPFPTTVRCPFPLRWTRRFTFCGSWDRTPARSPSLRRPPGATPW